MKVIELLEASKASSVQIKNKGGFYKKFKSMSAPGAEEFRNSWDDPNKKPEKPEKAPKITDADIMSRVDGALGSAMDGVDPMDTIGRWMEKNNIDMDRVDKVVNKSEKIKTGLYGYIASAWDDLQADRVSDAKHSKNKDDHESNEFYRIKDGKVIPSQNPWK